MIIVERTIDDNLVTLAEEIATEAHKGQFRYDKITPFIEHPKAVVNNLNWFIDYKNINKLQVIAWLHDVIEDTNITLSDLLNKGIPLEIVNIIDILSRRKDENYLFYILRVKNNSIAKKIKLADLKHNMSTSTIKNQIEKYQLAKYILES